MSTIEYFTVAMIIHLGLCPNENNAARLSKNCTTSNENIQYKTEMRGSDLYLKTGSDDNFISPLNDVPLNTGQEDVFRAVIVAPKLKTSEVKQILMSWDMNPICQMFNNNNYILQWDYGALSQTWEDPCVIDSITNQMGDNGQLDVFVLSKHSYDCGAVVNVKIVGAYPMIVLETGMTNWQMIAIDVKDQKADSVNNLEDLNKNFPGMLVDIKEWLKRFNVEVGNKYNKVFKVKDANTAVHVITTKHNQWKTWQETLRFAPNVNPYNTTLNNKWTIAPWMNLLKD